jgi:hypothetical protein
VTDPRLIRRRVTVGAAIVLAIAGVAALTGRRAPRSPARDTEQAAERLPASPRRVPAPVPGYYRAPDRRAPTYSFGRPNPVIERVLVDKTEVCRGEENFVRVDVSTVDDSDADLKILLQGSGFLGSGSTGSRLPLRLFALTNAEQMPTVVVFGKGGTFAQQQVPFVHVKDCDADPFLRLEAQKRSDEGPAVYELHASLGAEHLTNVAWTFGDGSTATKQEPSVTHDYGQREQRSRFSEFLISATATDAQGRTVRGHQTLELLNREYLRDRQGS